MTIPELNGKLSPHKSKGLHDRMEDLLPSNILRTMKHAGWEIGFINGCHFLRYLRMRREDHEPWATTGDIS